MKKIYIYICIYIYIYLHGEEGVEVMMGRVGEMSFMTIATTNHASRHARARPPHLVSTIRGGNLRWVSPGEAVPVATDLSQDPPPTAILSPIHLPTAILTSSAGVATA